MFHPNSHISPTGRVESPCLTDSGRTNLIGRSDHGNLVDHTLRMLLLLLAQIRTIFVQIMAKLFADLHRPGANFLDY